MIFVFGSNEAGRHGRGAALYAVQKHGAIYGQFYGHVGNSFGIPTKDSHLRTLSTQKITNYVDGFLTFAYTYPALTFQVTRVGCGLAGLPDELMASLFEKSSENCWFDLKWKPLLGESKNYWGTF